MRDGMFFLVIISVMLFGVSAQAGAVVITPDGLSFSDNTTQTTAATGNGDGHSLDTPDGSGVDVVYVDDTANVGIGTQQPARKLHLSEAMRLEPMTAGPADAGQGDLYFDASDALCTYMTTGWVKITGNGACGSNINALTFSSEALGGNEVVTLNYSQTTRPDATAASLQPRIVDLTIQWQDAFLTYVSVARGQAAIDADKSIALSTTTPLADPAGWTEGRFILLNSGNTNRIAPGELLKITFSINDTGLTTLKWDQLHTGFAPAESGDILTMQDSDVQLTLP